MYKTLLFLIFSYFALIVNSQTKDDNIIITDKEESYTFIVEKAKVYVKETSVTDYLCTQMSSSINVAEFYNEKSTIDKVQIKGVFGITPQYATYKSDNIFYSDAKICYFNLPFDKKEKTAQVRIEKTYNDPRYFTTVYFPENLFIRSKKVTITVPYSINVEFIEKNFGENISKSVKDDPANKKKIYTYHIVSEATTKIEEQMPGQSYIYPHLLILTKSVSINGNKIPYLETIDDLYGLYNGIIKQMNNDANIIKSKSEEITKNCKTEEEKINAIFSWVQDNIRYVAFEDGIAAFKPDDAQEVLRKKYGDCKGMSNLLCSLLKSEGFDARLSWLGTNHIAYNYETPSLAVNNHMICTLFYNDSIKYLDPTIKYMPLGEYPQTIQGRQIMIENGEKYILNTIPVFPTSLNTDSLFCEYSIIDGTMKGNATHSFKGESKQVLMSLMDATPQDKLDNAIKSFFEKGQVQDKVSEIEVSGNNSTSRKVSISYSVANKSGLQTNGDEYYIDLDQDKDFMTAAIDTVKRVNDFQHLFRYHIINNTTLNIPEGYEISFIPPTFVIDKEDYIFKINYHLSDNKIIYRKEIIIKNIFLVKSKFKEWNSDIDKLRSAYMEQISLIKKHAI